MARHRQDDAWIWVIPKVVAFLLVIGLLNPTFRQALASPFMWLFVLVVVAIGVLVVHLMAGRQETTETSYTSNVFVPSAGLSAGTRTDRLGLAPSSPALAMISAAPKVEKRLCTEELMMQLRAIDWFQFEKVVALTYGKLGYSVTRRGGANADGGIDLMIEKDGERFAVQCKQWKAWVVGVKTVREFLGALTDSQTKRGALVTLRGYTSEAKELADKHGIELITQMRLAEMLEATNARFDPETLEILRDTRKFCPKCEREMVLKPARKGKWAGQKFWGCSGYPRCRYILR